eukprot:TRINITY_DN8399_c0_g3_i3.p1 TRINITY_DN8399_c0_g3~~TRINITY_DN8399_c0_g3_i3.p1  ORF type:complete len:323 (+),score=74.78 TRINITY_DN8399_c0_g3_i3:1122-2090(+)
MIFGIYALGVFHFRLKAIKERRNSKVFEDPFGPYLLVLVFILALILSAIIPTLHFSTQINRYPSVPASLLHTPNVYQFLAPLPTSSFPWINRTKGFSDLLGSLQALPYLELGVVVPQNIGGTTDLKETVITLYKVKDSKTVTIPGFSVYDNPMENEVMLEIESIYPSFDMVHYNTTGKGKNLFLLNFDCKATEFSLQSTFFNPTSPVAFRQLGDIDVLFPNISALLGVPIETHLFKSRFQSYVWEKNILVSDTPSSLILQLDYDVTTAIQNKPEPYQEPKKATLALRFDELYRTSSVLISAQELITQFVTLQWNGEWPQICS